MGREMRAPKENTVNHPVGQSTRRWLALVGAWLGMKAVQWADAHYFAPVD
jgi:hypothetical protein